MFTHQIEIGHMRACGYTIVYVAERIDGRIVLFNPSRNTVRVIEADEFDRTDRKRCTPIPAGIVAGAGMPVADLVLQSFQQQVVSSAMFPAEWALKS